MVTCEASAPPWPTVKEGKESALPPAIEAGMVDILRIGLYAMREAAHRVATFPW